MSKVANIKFNGGIIHTPSDVSPMDGDLNECINLVSSDGELKPVEQPVKTNVTPRFYDDKLAAVHNINENKFFVFAVYNSTNDASYINIKNETDYNPVFSHTISKEEVKWVEIVGNTLIFSTDKSMHYALYKGGTYKWLGDSLPRPVFDVKIGSDDDNDYYNHTVTEPIPTGVEYADSGGTEREYVCLDLNNDFSYYYQQGTAFVSLENGTNQAKRYIMNNFNSKMAKLLYDIKENGRFIYPFFVRYALRLYDGTHTSESLPILMLPSTNINPILALMVTESIHRHGTSNAGGGNGNLHLKAKGQPLSYKFVGFVNANNANISDISEWGDIIKGVDMFLSSEIATYDSVKHNSYENVPTKFMTYVPSITDANMFGKCYRNNACIHWITEYFFNTSSGVFVNMGTTMIASNIVPGYSDVFKYHLYPIESLEISEINKKIADTNIFYKAKEYTLNDLENWGSSYRCFHNEVNYGFLVNLETKQVLKDEYLSRSRKNAKAHYSYNGRLILGGLNVEAPLWYPITEKPYYADNADFELLFEIQKASRTIVVKAQGGDVGKYRFGHYIFYPDVDCKKVYAHMNMGGNDYWAKINMAEHTGLNGSYAMFDNLETLGEYLEANGVSSLDDVPAETADRYYDMSNALIMSPVSNPFAFNASNAIEVESGNILGMASMSVPMSEGQYGQYPIIVFTDNGIHAVGIANDGTFTGVSPVSSADSLMNAPRLGQPNIISDGQSIYFITKRGLMELRGLQVRCVSEILDGRSWNHNDYVNSINASQSTLQYQNIVTMLRGGITDKHSFNQTVNDGDAFLAFDYKHNRIIVTDPTRTAHWIYSIADRKWTKLMFNDDYKCDDDYFINIAQATNYEEPKDRTASVATTDGRKIVASVFNWNESYVQTANGELWDLMGAADENDDRYYKYGFIASRPIRFGSDDYKSLTRILHRKRINSQKGFAGMRLYGSVDGIKFYEITSLRGASYKYFVVLLYTCMKANERYSYMSVEFEEKFQNKLR